MDNEQEEQFIALSRDLRKAAESLSEREVRFIVSYYYLFQESRKRAANQLRALRDQQQPHGVIDWLTDNAKRIEYQIRAALLKYVESKQLGRWLLQHYGIGPVISAGFLSHFNIERAPTYGHYWSFAGQTTGFGLPIKWEKGQKRPWNAELKTLCYKAGDCFVKFSAKPNCFYGQLYLQKKQSLIMGNESGKFVSACEDGKSRVSKNTEAWKWYAGCYVVSEIGAWRRAMNDLEFEIVQKDIEKKEAEKLRQELAERLKPKAHKPGEGTHMLPPAHIDMRARRFAVKMFIAHFWEESYRQHYRKEPAPPYPIDKLGHVHLIKSPVLSLAMSSE